MAALSVQSIGAIIILILFAAYPAPNVNMNGLNQRLVEAFDKALPES
ncbi:MULTISPECIES: hypothetical protein [Ochrobactrum]|jgi:hypothetical protein|uniref:Uncharacterized protein n=1 Tax=Ochrobactrum quorumnocens TaxID=271865 RepID=A0A248UGW1_9HYPH|nr:MULTISPECIES: hypothetical protein [Brucella/Ochrobactrum group]ASV85862.1 hypothetical protein CES85_0283 [[Ochrobactrum] quorumnocens]MBD7992992.1 hypothetical protein [Ochrobactrum gallinarum]MCV9906535.1 hypothetical protein [Brucella sp. HL-2]MDH7789872.1 hypothetical protein [Ochrobactrum sp. AN78]